MKDEIGMNLPEVRKILHNYFEITSGRTTLTNNFVNVICSDSNHSAKIRLGVKISEIPLKFGVVDGDFLCYDKALTSLKNSPRIVNGQFNCSKNPALTNFDGAPDSVTYFFCQTSGITSLAGSPKIGIRFDVSDNKYLYNLVGAPDHYADFFCSSPYLTSLEGLPQNVKNIRLRYTRKLPMLRLIMSKAKITYIMDDRFATRIINKYREGPHTKSAILACQKELIDNDLIQNAGW